MNTTVLTEVSSEKYYFLESHNSAQMKGIITLFTPTFNRANFLERLYKIILNQTSDKFVWLVVNDGSTDNTYEVIKKFIEENKIPIKYIHKENGGKHSAFKIALDNCLTEYFLCIDDDDLYEYNSIEFFLKRWEDIRNEKKDDIGAIRVLSKRIDGSIVTDSPKKIQIGRITDISTLDMRYKEGIRMENWTCYSTNALREIDLFSQDYWLSEVHTFFSEGIWQSRFARKYLCRYIFIPLSTYTYDAQSSILRTNKSKSHYLNMFLNAKMRLDEEFDYINKFPIKLIKQVALIQLLRGYLGVPLKDLIIHTNTPKLKKIYKFTSPLAKLGSYMIGKKNN